MIVDGEYNRTVDLKVWLIGSRVEIILDSLSKLIIESASCLSNVKFIFCLKRKSKDVNLI